MVIPGNKRGALAVACISVLVCLAALLPATAAGAATYDANGPEGTIYRLYRAYFLREPDAAGFAYWMDVHSRGYPVTDISENFTRSQEFQSRYGPAVTNNDFVTLVYNNVLDRDPDSSGHAYWVNQMNNHGMPRGVVMINFSDSAEFRSKTADGVPPGYEKLEPTLMRGEAVGGMDVMVRDVTCPQVSDPNVTVYASTTNSDGAGGKYPVWGPYNRTGRVDVGLPVPQVPAGTVERFTIRCEWQQSTSPYTWHTLSTLGPFDVKVIRETPPIAKSSKTDVRRGETITFLDGEGCSAWSGRTTVEIILGSGLGAVTVAQDVLADSQGRWTASAVVPDTLSTGNHPIQVWCRSYAGDRMASLMRYLTPQDQTLGGYINVTG